MALKILTLPKYESALRRQSKNFEISRIKAKYWQKFFDALCAKMLQTDGVGLAAPQVNQPLRIFCVKLDQSTAKIIINPRLKHKSLFKNIAEEGCLSIPKIYGVVKRHNSIQLDYFDRQGQTCQRKFSGLLARVIQHEYDHLDGVLFIDKTLN